MPEYPSQREIETGMWVEIEQEHGNDPIRGEVGAVVDEDDTGAAVVKLKSGARGRVRDIVPEDTGPGT